MDAIVPHNSYKIYCEQMGDADLSDTKFVEESRNLFAMIPASRKPIFSCIFHFFNKVARLSFSEEGDKLISEKVNTDEKAKSGDKSNVNKKALEMLTNVFGSIVFKAHSNTGSNDVSASGAAGKEAGNCFRIALLIDRVERPFKPPTLDVSGDEAPLPSKPYAWFNSTLTAAEAQAGLEGSASGTFFVMRNEENPSEYKMYYVSSAGIIGSFSIVKTANNCWKKAGDDFSLFVSLRSLVEYFVSIGYLKNPFVTNQNSIPMNTDFTSDPVSPSSPAQDNVVACSPASSSTRKKEGSVSSSSSSSRKKHSGSSSSSSSKTVVGGDGSLSAKSGEGSSSKRHHKSSHSHKHKSKKSKDEGGNEDKKGGGEEEEEDDDQQMMQINPQDYDFNIDEVPPLGPLIKPN